MYNKKAAVILSGCGFLDGAEIRESVLSLLYLDQAGVEASIFAPNSEQSDVIDHAKQSAVDEKRNIFVESARIARSKISDLAELDASAFDMLVIPGGFGVAKNLSRFATDGPQAPVMDSFAKAITAFYDAGKPIAAICIAPAVLALVLKNKGIRLTIGEDQGTAAAIESLGHTHVNAVSHDTVVDETHKIATCSAYMREDAIGPIAQGIEKTIQAVVQLSQ